MNKSQPLFGSLIKGEIQVGQRRNSAKQLSLVGWFVISILLAASSCTTTTAPANPPLLRTEVLTVELVRTGDRFAATIPYTFTNRTGGPVYLVNCEGAFAFGLERRDEEGWTTAWSPILPACLSPPIVIAEDEVWADTMDVYGSVPGTNSYPQFDVADPAGMYRIVWSALSSYSDDYPSFGRLLPLSQRLSNSFQIVTK